LHDEHDDAEHQTPVNRQFLHKWGRVFQHDHEGAGDHDEYLDEWDGDDDSDKWCGVRAWNDTLLRRGVHPYTADEVPEELAVEQTPEARPDTVDASEEGNEASPIVPDEISHYDVELGLVEGVDHGKLGT